MKKTNIAILSAIITTAIIILLGGGYVVSQFDEVSQFGGGGLSTITQTMAGSATQFTAMPSPEVYASNTTTDALAWDTSTGGVVTQELLVDGITKISLIVEAEGGTATSTLSVKPFISYDGTTFSEVYASSTPNMNATSSLPTLAKVDSWDPGITTSTKAWIMEIPAAKYLRLVWMGENLSTDPLDGVKAHIQVGLEQGN